MRQRRLISKVLELLKDGKPRTSRQIIQYLGIKPKNGYELLRYMWKNGLVLRTRKPFFVKNVKSAGRRTGSIVNTKKIHLYVIADDRDEVVIDNVVFEKYNPEKHVQKISKSKIIVDFLKKNKDKAFFAREITDALKDKGITNVDVSVTIRRLERKGLILRRGFRTHERELPFQKGFIVSWIDQSKNIIKAMEEAEERIRQKITEYGSDNETWIRVNRIYQICKSFARDKQLVSYEFLLDK